jgi:hypothetical protein
MSVSLTEFVDPKEKTLAARSVNAVPGSDRKTLSFLDETVASLQPDGTLDVRPKGTAGPWELCSVDGQVATWSYTWDGKQVGPKTFAFVLVKV